MKLQDEKSLSHYRKNFFAFCALSIIIFAIYSNTFDASFHFDDYRNFINHPGMQIKAFTWPEVKKTFFADRGRLYRPVSAFSLALNHYLAGTDPFTYHLTNIVIHCLSAIFLFLFVYQTVSSSPVERLYQNHPYSIALLAGILWASNPLQTQAITYVVQRMASLAGLFYIMALYLYALGRTASNKSSRIPFFILCVFSSLLSFGSKENTFVLPATILLYEVMIVRRQDIGNWIKRKKWTVLIVLIAAALVPVCYLYLHYNGHMLSFLKGYQVRVFSLGERLLTEPRVLLLYVSLLLYPLPGRLSILHDISISTSLMEPATTLLSIAVIAGIIGGAIFMSRRAPLSTYCVIFFFLNHVIESSFLPLELVFEHRNYIPSMLLFVPISALLISGVYARGLKKVIRGLILVMITGVVIFYGNSTLARNSVWKTEETLWLDALSKAPALWRPWHDLGRVYAERRDHAMAINLFSTALTKRNSAKKDDKYLTHYNLGVVFQRIGNNKKALFHYGEAERIYPKFSGAHNNRGAIFASQGLWEEALTELQKAAAADRSHQADALSNLGYLMLKHGQAGEAIKVLEASMDILPQNALTLTRLGYAYRQIGAFGKAYRMYTRALEIQPLEVMPYLYLAEIYQLRGMSTRKRKAMEKFFTSLGSNGIDDFISGLLETDESSNKMLMDQKRILELILDGCSETLRQELQWIELIEQKIEGTVAG